MPNPFDNIKGAFGNIANVAQDNTQKAFGAPMTPTPTNTAGKFSNIAGGAAGAVTALGQAMPGAVDRRIGMEKPNLLKENTDFTFAAAGSAFGPWGTVVGAGIDLVKNNIAYQKHKTAYEAALNKESIYKNREDRIQGQEADYTGYARYGMFIPNYGYGGMTKDYGYGGMTKHYQYGGMTPAVLEQNEVVVQKQPNGSYAHLATTPPNAPSHEQGGVPMMLPPNTRVFPQNYMQSVYANMNNPQAMDQLSNQMQAQSQAAAQAGMPYSSGGMMRYGSKKKY